MAQGLFQAGCQRPAPMANILIIEDEPAVQELLAFDLKLAGFSIFQAHGVSDAWAHINRASPRMDLIVLSWLLPDGYGIDFLRNLREDEQTYLIPVVMLTARADESCRAAGLRHGETKYIAKPFSLHELTACIRTMLEKCVVHDHRKGVLLEAAPWNEKAGSDCGDVSDGRNNSASAANRKWGNR